MTEIADAYEVLRDVPFLTVTIVRNQTTTTLTYHIGDDE